MAFPSDHAYPRDLPAWRLRGHELQAGERVDITQFDQGEDRHREIRTFTPWLAAVSTLLRQSQFDRLCEWHEVDLQAGTQRFDTRVANLQGRYTQWWQAQFVGPFRAVARARDQRYAGVGHLWEVSAELILLDGPYAADTGSPGGDVRVPPGIFARSISEDATTVGFFTPGLNAWSEADDDIEAEQSMGLDAWVEEEDEITATFQPVSFLLLPDGVSYLLLPDGVSRLALPET